MARLITCGTIKSGANCIGVAYFTTAPVSSLFCIPPLKLHFYSMVTVVLVAVAGKVDPDWVKMKINKCVVSICDGYLMPLSMRVL
eukprot:10417155-Ditylum_brightwellii.AAC.1